MIKYIFLFLFLTASLSLYSQNTGHLIVGDWDLKYKLPKTKEVVFKRASEETSRRISFRKDQKLNVESNVLFCGLMDLNEIKKNNFKGTGTWKFNKESNVLITSFSVFSFGKKFKVLEISAQEMKLKMLDDL